MPDMEKVIRALECRKNADKRCGNPCENTGFCHYATALRDINGEIYRPFICDRERICADTLALLKDQQQRIETLEIDRDILVKDINTNNCNTCKRQCEHRPELGDVVRANCFMWEGW